MSHKSRKIIRWKSAKACRLEMLVYGKGDYRWNVVKTRQNWRLWWKHCWKRRDAAYSRPSWQPLRGRRRNEWWRANGCGGIKRSRQKFRIRGISMTTKRKKMSSYLATTADNGGIRKEKCIILCHQLSLWKNWKRFIILSQSSGQPCTSFRECPQNRCTPRSFLRWHRSGGKVLFPPWPSSKVVASCWG